MGDFTKDFIQKQKIRLLEEKERIQQNFKLFEEETKDIAKETVTEDGDVAQKYLDQKMNFSLREKDLRTLREIDVALRKIDDGTYGYCEESGEPIELKRLEKRPWARLSLHHAEEMERENQQIYKRLG